MALDASSKADGGPHTQCVPSGASEPMENSILSEQPCSTYENVARLRKFCCLRCRQLDLQKMFDAVDPANELSTVRERIFEIGEVRAEHQTSPCPLCRLFVSSLFAWGTGFTNDSCENKHFSLWRSLWTCRVSRKKQVVLFTSDNSGRNYWTWFRDGPISPEHMDQGLIGLGEHEGISNCCMRKRPTFVDFDLLRSWISDCDQHHSACKQAEAGWPADSIVQLLDCDSLELVPASKSAKYAALSYVWGTSKAPDAAASFQIRLEELPSLIQDAIYITKSLGLKYLWVDQYCVSQHNPKLKMDQIKSMDVIYNSAYVVLIALTDDPTGHVPGIRTPRRQQPLLSLGGLSLLNSLPPLQTVVQQSKWWTRAWTFQEVVLARRRLYFSADQVYFECQKEHHCEAVEHEPMWDDERDYLKWPWRQPIIRLTPNLGSENLRQLLEIYFKRNMTYESDALNAFLGVLQHFSRAQNPIQHYFGLPFQAFSPAQRRDQSNAVKESTVEASFIKSLQLSFHLPVRRVGFPSWSWAGWRAQSMGLMDFDYLDDGITVRVQVECPKSGALRDMSDFCVSGDFNLTNPSLSPFIWLEAPTVRIQFLDQSETKFSTGRSLTSRLVVLSSLNVSLRQKFYLEILGNGFPDSNALAQYSDLVAMELLKTPFNRCLMIIGQRLGQMERVYCERFGHVGNDRARMGSVEHSNEARLKYNLPVDPDQVALDDLNWTPKSIRLG